MLKFDPHGRLERGTQCFSMHVDDLVVAVDEAMSALRNVVMYLGPKPPRHLKCIGCEYERSMALDIANHAIENLAAKNPPAVDKLDR